MMAPKLYTFKPSPPARAVIVTAAAIGLELDIIVVEHDYLRTDEFLKLNPQHTIPLLIDGDVVIYDSHVIATYLVGKYAKDDLLYPCDLKDRAMVDQRLYYDTGVMHSNLQKIAKFWFSKVSESVPKDLIDDTNEMYSILETYLNKTEWLAGNHVTLADISCSMTIKAVNLPLPYDSIKYPKLASWMEKLNSLPYFSVDEPYFQEFKNVFKALSSQKS